MGKTVVVFGCLTNFNVWDPSKLVRGSSQKKKKSGVIERSGFQVIGVCIWVIYICIHKLYSCKWVLRI